MRKKQLSLTCFLAVLMVLSMTSFNSIAAEKDSVANRSQFRANELQSGVTVTSSLAAQYATEMWTIAVGSDAISMESILTCGSADFDLYGRLGAEPTTSTYDWRGYTSGGEEVTTSNPGQGTWYIMVRSYSGTGSYSLTVTIEEEASQNNELFSGVTSTSSLPARYATEMWYIVVGANVDSMESVLTCGSADFDLYGRLGAEPTTSTYDWRGYTSGGEEVTTSNPGQGTWYIMVRSYSGTGSYSLTVTLNGGGTSDTEAPTVSITSPSNGATVSDTITVSVYATDNVGVTGTAISIDSGSYTTNLHWDTTSVSNGAHTIRARAWDAAGNYGYSSTFTVTVDNTVQNNELQSGVTATSSLAAQYATEMWTIEVGADITSMHSVLTCGSSDFDLYGRLGAEPTTSTYDWRGYTSGGEDVTTSNPGQGTWYIMVRSYSGTGSYSLTVTLTEGGGTGDWGTGGKYAIIVGISNYLYISDLSYCDEDATDWNNQLVGLGYECHVYGDQTNSYPNYYGTATESNVRAAVQELAAHAQSGDDVCFLTSGHGDGTGSGSSYLCMLDCSGSSGCYYDTELASDIGQFDSGVNIFVFIDHCYSGGMGPELMALSNNDYIYCTTTCTDDGYGYDDPSHQNGAWTYYFLAYSWQSHYGGDAGDAMETVFDYALAAYPHSGGDTPQEFDGNSGSNFYL